MSVVCRNCGNTGIGLFGGRCPCGGLKGKPAPQQGTYIITREGEKLATTAAAQIFNRALNYNAEADESLFDFVTAEEIIEEAISQAITLHSSELERENERLRRILEHKTGSCQRRHAFCQDCCDKLPDNHCWRCENQRLQSQIDGLQFRLDGQKSTNRRLQDERDAARPQRSEAQSRITDLEGEVERLTLGLNEVLGREMDIAAQAQSELKTLKESNRQLLHTLNNIVNEIGHNSDSAPDKATLIGRIETCINESAQLFKEHIQEEEAFGAELEAEIATLKEQVVLMGEALRSVTETCGPVNFSSHNQMREAVEGSLAIAEEALQSTQATREEFIKEIEQRERERLAALLEKYADQAEDKGQTERPYLNRVYASWILCKSHEGLLEVPKPQPEAQPNHDKEEGEHETSL